MKYRLYLPIALVTVILLAVTSCSDDDAIGEGDLTIPKGYALSAGTSTIFSTSSFAYDSEADWVTGDLKHRFIRGDKLYDDARTSSNDYGGGLGPVYAGYSCGSCHRNAGRTKPALWTQTGSDPDGTPVYGSGSYGFSSMLVYVTRKNGAFFQDYGRVIHDQSIYGVTAEGKLECRWHTQQFQFPDGTPYELAYPEYTITDWYKPTYRDTDEPIRPEDLFCTVRIPLRHVGMGQMMGDSLAIKHNMPTLPSNWDSRATWASPTAVIPKRYARGSSKCRKGR